MAYGPGSSCTYEFHENMNFAKNQMFCIFRRHAETNNQCFNKPHLNPIRRVFATLLPGSRLWVWINTVKYSDLELLTWWFRIGESYIEMSPKFQVKVNWVCLRHGAPWPSNGFLMVFDTSQRCLLALGEMGEMSEQKIQLRGLHRFWIIQCHILVDLGKKTLSIFSFFQRLLSIRYRWHIFS